MSYKSKDSLIVSELRDKKKGIDSLNASLRFDKDEFLFTLRKIVLAQEGGFASLSKTTGMGKESLYKALSPRCNPRFDTILKVLHALKLNIHIEPLDSTKQSQQFLRKNSLVHHFPSIALQWHSTKNKSLTPNDVLPGSKKKVWWQCGSYIAHAWKESCNSRITHNYNCPLCEQ